MQGQKQPSEEVDVWGRFKQWQYVSTTDDLRTRNEVKGLRKGRAVFQNDWGVGGVGARSSLELCTIKTVQSDRHQPSQFVADEE